MDFRKQVEKDATGHTLLGLDDGIERMYSIVNKRVDGKSLPLIMLVVASSLAKAQSYYHERVQQGLSEVKVVQPLWRRMFPSNGNGGIVVGDGLPMVRITEMPLELGLEKHYEGLLSVPEYALPQDRFRDVHKPDSLFMHYFWKQNNQK